MYNTSKGVRKTKV